MLCVLPKISEEPGTVSVNVTSGVFLDTFAKFLKTTVSFAMFAKLRVFHPDEPI